MCLISVRLPFLVHASSVSAYLWENYDIIMQELKQYIVYIYIPPWLLAFCLDQVQNGCGYIQTYGVLYTFLCSENACLGYIQRIIRGMGYIILFLVALYRHIVRATGHWAFLSPSLHSSPMVETIRPFGRQ